MKCSEVGLNLIKSFEGLRLTTYADAGGTLTIGYGHTRNVRRNQKISIEQADDFLRADVVTAENAVNKWVNTYRFSQSEFDALVSFAFNLGAGNVNKLVANGKRSRKEIADAMPRYCHAGGKKLTGLVKRREAEKALFLSGSIIAKAEPSESAYISVAANCIKGFYGNGETRRKKVTAMGYNYAKVQSLVNKYLKKGHF